CEAGAAQRRHRRRGPGSVGAGVAGSRPHRRHGRRAPGRSQSGARRRARTPQQSLERAAAAGPRLVSGDRRLGDAAGEHRGCGDAGAEAARQIGGASDRVSELQQYQPTVDLARLRDIVVPAAISYAPQTAGWYVLGALLLVLIAWIVAGAVR